MIIFDGSLETFWNLDSILVFDNVSISMSRNDIGNTDKPLRILGRAPLPLSMGYSIRPIESGKGASPIILRILSVFSIPLLLILRETLSNRSMESRFQNI